VASAVRDALGLAGSVARLPLTPPRVRGLAEAEPGSAAEAGRGGRAETGHERKPGRP